MKPYSLPIALCALLLCSSLIAKDAASDCLPYQLEARRADQTVLAQIPLPDNRWCMYWHHSVAGFLVQDCYNTDRGELMLYSSHQPDFAAGLGHTRGRGELRSDPRGGYLIEGINEPVTNNQYWIRIGSDRVNHRIVTADDDVNLSTLAAGELINIRLITEGATCSGTPPS